MHPEIRKALKQALAEIAWTAFWCGVAVAVAFSFYLSFAEYVRRTHP